MRRVVAALVLSAAVMLVGAAPSVAATAFLYASPSGSTSAASCTDQNAPCSLPHALALAHAGDDLTVLPGEYDLAGQLSAPVSIAMHGVAGQPRPVIVDKSGFNFPLQLGNGGGSLRHIAFQSPAGNGYVLDANIALIEDVSITGPSVTGGGLYLRAGELRDSTVFVTTSSTNVSGVIASAGTLRNVTSVVSSVQTTGNVGLVADSGGGATASVTAVNVIAIGPGADVGAHNSSASTGSATLTIDHSDFAKAPSTSGHNASVAQTATVTAAPVLVDATHGDFHELLGSPSIDAGISDPENGIADFDGNPRELGGGPDIGALEYLPAPTVTTSAASAVMQTSASLNGTVNPNGAATTVQFVIDTGPGAPQAISVGALPASTTAQAVTASATGLTAGATYTYHLHAANATGPADGAEQSFTTTGAQPAPPVPMTPVASAPVLSAFGLTHTRFVVGRARHGIPSGTAFTFTLSGPAAVTIRIQRLAAGRRSHGHCVAPGHRLRRAKPCTRTIAAGSLHRNATAGPGRIAFSGKLGGKSLAPGRYRATISAASGAPRSKSFTIVGAR